MTGTQNGALTITDDSNGVNGSQQTVSLTGAGINPGGSLSPTSLAFGNQVIGTTSAARKVTLTSTGATNLILSGIAITGANAGDFAQTNNCPTSTAPGASCSVNVTFIPSATGLRTGSVTVTDNATNSPQITSLTGTGVLPVTLTPVSYSFPTQAVNTTSAPKVFTLSNNQNSALSMSGITFAGTNSGDFSETDNCGTSVAAKGTCAISVTFTPSATGKRNATLSVADNASNTPQTAALLGTSVAQVVVSPASLTFAPQTVSTTSPAKTVTLTNNLNSTLTISSVATSGINSGDFAQTNTCGTSVAAHSNCTLSASFTPTAKGARTASITITDSANNSPQTVSLTGTGK